MKKQIDWETDNLYIIVRHHDEHISDELGLCHRLHIIDSGTMIDLHDRRDGAVPQHYCSTDSIPPKRTARISGITTTILPVNSFQQWWDWFRNDKSRPIVVVSDIDESWVRNQVPFLINQSDSLNFSD